MSYTPTNWVTGDVITAEKLNNIEQGIVGAGDLFVINATNVATSTNPSTKPTLDKTYDEIKAAYDSGMIPVVTFKETSPFGEVLSLAELDVFAEGEGSEFDFVRSSIGFNNAYAGAAKCTIRIGETMVRSTYEFKQLAYYTES